MALYPTKPASKAGVEPPTAPTSRTSSCSPTPSSRCARPPEFDDMTWAEIDNALLRASHLLKVNWTATGTIQPPPPPEEPPVARRT